MRPEMELSLAVEFNEVFSLRDRIRIIADRVRSQLIAAGIGDQMEAEIFDGELELRGPDGSHLLVRMDSFHLEINGAPPDLQIHHLGALILDEAEVFRLTTVEAGFATGLEVPGGKRLGLVAQAYGPLADEVEGPMLDRRFSMTWEWGNATTGFSFFVNDTEDRELWLSFKAREGYMTVPELKSGKWIMEQGDRFKRLVTRFLDQIDWGP